ncbi:unnamed protein product [Clavelina lepadiformis]|uniref:Diacylglycerol kinase type I N-terminal domain-containing protein n=1 Tax=Clavelina lepadiformis TaxID=159417 RepID=A0ABP0FI37_CLALP
MLSEVRHSSSRPNKLSDPAFITLITAEASLSSVTSESEFVTLTSEEFERLQTYIEYSSKKLSDVLREFDEDGILSNYNKEETIDYTGFKLFMETYFETELPEDFCIHLFRSFQKNVSTKPGKC